MNPVLFNILLRGPMYDPDSLAFFARGMVTDPTVRLRHDAIVRHLKAAGLWSSLYLWYGADGGALNSSTPKSPALDGQTVRQWINRKGDNHSSQATGSEQPTLDFDAGPNGLPALIADGVSNGFHISNDVRLRPPLTFCVFGKDMAASGSGLRYILGHDDPSTATTSDLLIVSDFGTLKVANFNGSTFPSLFNFPFTRSGNKLVTHVYNGANSFAWATGDTDATGTLATVTPSGIGPGLMLFRSAGGNYCSGKFSHFMLFQSELVKAQHTALETLFLSL